MRSTVGNLVRLFGPLLFLLAASCTTPTGGGRCGFWIDVYRGEPTPYEEIIDDLAGVRVIYLGERHTLDRHHALQERIVQDLAARGLPLVLGLEQMEFYNQPILDEYNRGQIDFDELAEKSNWAKRWSNYEDYRPIVEAAHAAGVPILALNAKAETVRQVARRGLDGLEPSLRRELPADIDLDNRMYEQHLAQVMMVHAMMPAKMMRTVYEAQVARDETMADRLCQFLKSEAGGGRSAVVLCGAGHVSHGLGIPNRVQRRMPGLQDRIIVLSESGDVVLSEREKALTRDITITHEQLRILDKPIADYLHALNLKPASED